MKLTRTLNYWIETVQKTVFSEMYGKYNYLYVDTSVMLKPNLCSNGPGNRTSPEFQKLLGIAMEMFLLCSDDSESDVRMVADECLNKIIKVSHNSPFHCHLWFLFGFYLFICVEVILLSQRQTCSINTCIYKQNRQQWNW